MRATEEEAVLLMEPYLQIRCRGHWCTLEMEDRLAEARLAFLAAWRLLPTDTGNFLRDFDKVLDLHMKEVVRRQNSRTCSLDASLGKTGCTRYAFLAAPAFDESCEYVYDFFDSLPHQDHSILSALMDGYPRAEIARKEGLTTYQLNKKLQELGTKYLDEYGKESI